MEEQRISFETAKVAKEKGFDWKTNYYYDTAGDLCSEIRKVNWNQSKEKIYSNPNQSLLKKWLREKYHLYVRVAVNSITTHFPMIELAEIGGTHLKGPAYIKNYETYEEALEIGLMSALLLIEK